ncbi:MAG: glycosyltransferase [Actinobacteria bacterium]|nr:glycosyltransferase [Actinomycetota bacterium]
MKIGVIAPAPVPYGRGGYERHWSGFVNHVNNETSHQAELIKIPFPETNLHEVMDGYRKHVALDLSGFEIVFSGKYPGWMVEHPNHHVYMSHVLRGLYDTYPSSFPLEVGDPSSVDLVERLDRVGNDRSEIDAVFAIYDEALARLGPNHPLFGYPGPFARKLVHSLDRIGLSTKAIRRHTAVAQVVADRPGYFPADAAVNIIHPPTDLPLVVGTGPGGYLFSISRLDKPKRLDLLIEAFMETDVEVEFRIAGSGPEDEALKALAKGDRRIVFLGFVPDKQLPDLYASAIAVPFIPKDEDFGLITLEALQSSTPVITTTDSGGPTEVVEDGLNGWVVEPTTSALATAMTEACQRPDRSRSLGLAGLGRLADVNWGVATRLLVRPSPAASQRVTKQTSQLPPRRNKPQLLALNTFTAHDPRGGGQLRAFHLGRGLAKHFDVHLLSLAESHVPLSVTTSSPGFTETAVPRSQEHAVFEGEMGAKIGIPVNDIYGGLGLHLSPEYLRQLRELTATSDAIILSHPYMEPALGLAGVELPVIYDAYNVEARLKDSMFPPGHEADRAVQETRNLEAATLDRASLVGACSAEDAMMFGAVYGETPPIAVVPNGADIEAIPFVDGPTRIANRRRWLKSMQASPEQRVGIFLASWHQPNLDAAAALHEIAASDSRLLFLMVGSHCDYFRGKTLPDNVVQLGLIGAATKRALLAVADIGLNPMETGSGTNLKMVEYLASGMVPLTTPIGARGLPNAEGLFAVAEMDDFAAELTRIVEVDHDDASRVAQASRARKLVEDRFSWPKIAANFARRIEEVVF